MYSMTGYFLLGSKSTGRTMTPQMSVSPSRPLAQNTSGIRQPNASIWLISAFSSDRSLLPSVVFFNTRVGGQSTRDQQSVK